MSTVAFEPLFFCHLTAVYNERGLKIIDDKILQHHK